MWWRHLLCRVRDLVYDIFEHLAIRKHPVAIQEEDKRSEADEIERVYDHFVIHGGWHLVRVGNLVSLNTINYEER